MTVQNIKKGFTLIELLIVIAILGVLAVVVLVAINPVQQLARTRDAGRISSVAQLGHAVEAYYTAHNGTYPSDLATLATTGEINQIPGEVGNTLTSVCSGGDGETNGWCYTDGTTGFSVWSALEADTNLNYGSCGGTAAYAAYLTAAGRGCLTCSQPTTGLETDAICEN